MSFWGLYACCMLFFGILQHCSSRICMCVCWIWKKMRPVCLYSIHLRQLFFTSPPRSSAYRCISFCTINFVHLISTRTRYEMPERPEMMYLFFVAVKSWNLKQKFLQRWVGVIYPGDRGCFVLTTPNALTDSLDSLTAWRQPTSLYHVAMS